MQILAGIILLGVLIVFHELGHFLFAKMLGVRVLVFSVGFGPKIFGWKRGETEYRLSAIPLGGYVRMFGETLEEELSPEEKRGSFMHQPIWRKSLIAFAGPLFNFILPIILFFFLLVGTEQVLTPRVGTLVKGGVAESAGLRVGDLVTSVNGKAVTSFGEVADFIAHHPSVDVSLGVDRKASNGAIEKTTIMVRPESKTSNNPLEKDQAVGRIGILPAVEKPLIVVSDHSPLKAAGLANFDEIVAIDGKPVSDATTMNALLLHLKPGQHLGVLRAGKQIDVIVPAQLAMLGEAQPITVVNTEADKSQQPALQDQITATSALLNDEYNLARARFGVSSANGAINTLQSGSLAAKLGFTIGDRVVAIDGEKLLSVSQLQQAIVQDPFMTHVLGVIKENGAPQVAVVTLPKDVVDKMNLNSDLANLFGIGTVQIFTMGETIERKVSAFEALKRASVQTLDIGLLTAKSLWMLVRMEVPASQIGGPIMLFDVAQQAAQKGLPYYIFIMCMLSVNLGLLNLLPIPALDGGHLLLFGIEAVQRKPLTSRTRTIATQIGIALLLAIMAIAVFNDLSRLLK